MDDRDETRPGRRAGKNLESKKPLEEAGLTKEEVRGYAKELGLPNWNKPSNTCLATRVPFGEEITEEKLKLIRAAESFLADFGFEGFRVRHHGEIARLEFRQEDIQMAVEKRDEIVVGLEKIGYKHVTLDLAGY